MKINLPRILFVLFLGFGSIYAAALESEVFSARRSAFIKQMGFGIAVVKGADLALRNGDDYYKFRQTSDFYYLTGYEQPGAVALFTPDSGKQFILFIPKQEWYMIAFQGKQPEPHELMAIYNADTVFYVDDLETILPDYLKNQTRLYFKPDDSRFTDKILTMINLDYGKWPTEIISPFPIIHEQRLIKSKPEIEWMQKAIDITNAAHMEVMKAIEPGMNEYEIEAIVEYIYRKNGSPRWGFRSIVASGKNACILHYQDNNQTILKGGMMILDIGAEYGYYSADITRSFPVNGQFSDRQKEIYELVLKGHLAAINTVEPGTTIRDPEKACMEVLKEGLFNLGLITDKESDWQIKIWLPYPISHWLGLDVHDVGEYRQSDQSYRRLEPGMVLTIEPGLYFGEEMFEMIPELYSRYFPVEQLTVFCEAVRPAFEKYKNIGVRIEDDILVTQTGHRVLSEKSPRTVKEIESVMKQKSYLNP